MFTNSNTHTASVGSYAARRTSNNPFNLNAGSAATIEHAPPN